MKLSQSDKNTINEAVRVVREQQAKDNLDPALEKALFGFAGAFEDGVEYATEQLEKHQ